MLKKGKWKQLFTRRSSKTRDKKIANSSVCSLCGGMPLNDVSTLCDHHREQVTSSNQQVPLSNTSLLPQNATNAAKAPTTGILKKSKSGSSKTALPTSASKTVLPPISTPDNKTSQSTEENESELEFALAESVTAGSRKPVDALKQTDKTEINEQRKKDPEIEAEEKNDEFMAEEVDSANLFEHSRTENTVPIVIEPEEQKSDSPNKALTTEDSGLKRKISFTSSLPTQIFVIPSKEELKAAMTEPDEEQPPGLNDATNKLSKKNKYVISKEERELKKNKRKVALTVANKVWFGTDQPEQTVGEVEGEINEELEGGEVHSKYDQFDEGDDDDYDNGEDEEDDNDSVGGGGEERQNSRGTEILEVAVDESLSRISNNIRGQAREEVHKVDDQTDAEGSASVINDFSTMDPSSPSSPMNPNLSEPTPLSSTLPNVFSNSPLTIGSPEPDSLTESVQICVNKEPASANAADVERVLKTDEISNGPPNEESGPCSQEKNNEGTLKDESAEDKYGYEDEDGEQAEVALPREHDVEPKFTQNKSLPLTKNLTKTSSECHSVAISEQETNDPNRGMLSAERGQIGIVDNSHKSAFETSSSMFEQPGNQPTPNPAMNSTIPLDQETSLAAEISVKSSPDQEGPHALDTASSPPLEHDESPTNPRMLFGSVTLEFSNQSLFYSPNFGAQGADPSNHSGQEIMTGEESHRHFSIYNEMMNFLARSENSARTFTEADDTNVGRVTEITGSESGENSEEQQQEHDVAGQSPPSLEAEDEFEQHPSKRTGLSEEQKELRKD